MSSSRDRKPIADRLRAAFLKPAPPGSTSPVGQQSVEELEHANRWANDKERLIGLFAAPWAAAIAILLIGSLIHDDPAALLANGQLDKLHVSLSLYYELLAALLVLSVLMLAFAWFRKRTYLGIVMALYGLSLFDLHGWGFALPYILCAAWLLVRGYRLRRSLRQATGQPPGGFGAPSRARAVDPGRPRANKRYTPPTSRPGR